MNRTRTRATTATLAIGAAVLAGCESNNKPGPNGTHAGETKTVGGDTAQPTDGTTRTNGVGGNGNRLEMNGLH